jgi:hypothetical protein
MARRRSARHVRPTGRGALAAAQASLEADVARLRSTGFADQLELVRLAALVDGLAGQVQRPSLDLAALRQELSAARAAPVPPDPHVDLLSAQVAELRSAVGTQQAMLSDLHRRVLDVLARLEAPSAPDVPAAPAPPVAPTPSAAPAVAPPASAPPPVVPAGARVAPVDAARPVASPGADDPLDDETLLRLRMIRESYGR